MNWMLDLIRSRPRASRSQGLGSAQGQRRRTGKRVAVEALEGRDLMAIGSFFTGLFPNYSSTNSTNVTTAAQLKILRQPPKVSFPPYDISVRVAAVSDPAGTGIVNGPNVTVEGLAPAYSTVWLAYGQLGYFNTVTRANSSGYYLFNATLPSGATQLRVFAESLGQDYSRIATTRVTNANPVVTWDAIALDAIRTANLPADEASRALALVHVAQYDAVAAATKPSSAYLVHPAAIPGASPEAAADAAAATVLMNLFPAQANTFAIELKTDLANLKTRPFATDQSYHSPIALDAAETDPKLAANVENGNALGQLVAQQVLAARSNDRSSLVTTAGVIPNPNWGQVTPFALTSGAQVRPSAPPAVGTSAYDQALGEVTSLGRADSTTRTASQTAAARFWDDPAGTATDPGHWNAIAETVAIRRRTNLLTTARTFAALDVAMADAAIATADAKVAYNSARPIATIRATTDPTWAPLLATPSTPSYVSAHAAYGAAASTVLAAFDGGNTPFTTAVDTTDDHPSRTFANFAAAATEDAASRVYGGVNFRFDTTAGASLGTAVAKLVQAKFPAK